jgi:taurine dioxygenase
MNVGDRPLHNSVGIEFVGLDLDKDRAVEIVRTAVHRHACVLLRAQDLSPQQLSDISRKLGVPLPPYRPQYSLDGYPEIIQVGNLCIDGHVTTYLNRGGVEWHTDSPGSSHPPGYSILYCLESKIPDGGGETGFVSTVSGYRSVPDGLKAQISNVQVVHSFNTFNDRVSDYSESTVPGQQGALRERNKDTLDPIVQTHPATGELHLICLHTPFPYAFDDYPRTCRLLHQIIVGGRERHKESPAEAG